LNITLTAVNSALGAFTIPEITYLAIGYIDTDGDLGRQQGAAAGWLTSDLDDVTALGVPDCGPHRGHSVLTRRRGHEHHCSDRRLRPH
ncbi:MAG: hypothetical protein ACTHVY_13170, partial [Brevibacterium yomogidense]